MYITDAGVSPCLHREIRLCGRNVPFVLCSSDVKAVPIPGMALSAGIVMRAAFARICKKSFRERRESTVEMRELEYWQSLIEHSTQRWAEDSITRLNGSDRLYYIGGENGF